MQRTSRWRNALLTLKHRLPPWLRFWLATRWRRLATRHNDRAYCHLEAAKSLRAEAQWMSQNEPTNTKEGEGK